MIPANELAALQAAVSGSLDQTATIQRKATVVADGYGHASDNYTNLATAVACALSQPTAQLMQAYAARIGTLQAWTVRFPAGTDVRRDDQLLVAGLTLRAQAVLAPQSYSTCERVLATELR